MIGRLRSAGLLWPIVFTVPALCILIALGNWQWQRMHWKAALLRDLATARSAAPVPLAALASAVPSGLEALRFRRVQIDGTFDHANEFHVWQPARAGPAWSIITPLRVALPGSPINRVLVIRGAVPQAFKSANLRATGQLAGPQTISGRIRLNQPNLWANAPDTAKNQWYTRDFTAMAAHLHDASKGTVVVAPFFLEAEQQQAGPRAPKPDLKSLTLANRHLEYALTWWGLAATLAGVFAAFAWGRRKAAKS